MHLLVCQVFLRPLALDELRHLQGDGRHGLGQRLFHAADPEAEQLDHPVDGVADENGEGKGPV